MKDCGGAYVNKVQDFILCRSRVSKKKGHGYAYFFSEGSQGVLSVALNFPFLLVCFIKASLGAKNRTLQSDKGFMKTLRTVRDDFREVASRG